MTVWAIECVVDKGKIIELSCLFDHEKNRLPVPYSDMGTVVSLQRSTKEEAMKVFWDFVGDKKDAVKAEWKDTLEIFDLMEEPDYHEDSYYHQNGRCQIQFNKTHNMSGVVDELQTAPNGTTLEEKEAVITVLTASLNEKSEAKNK